MKLRHVTATAVGAAATLFLAGCASTGTESTASATTNTSSESERVISSQKQEIARLERELTMKQSEIQRAESAAQSASASAAGGSDTMLFPPNPKPGECYARVLTPANYRTETETVLTKQASERVEIIPAKYQTVDERVLVKEASTRLEIVPAQYGTIEERILVKPETKKIVEVPATYKTVSERVLVTPARTEWKRGPAASFSSAGAVLDSRETDTGEIMCLVEVPAVYRDVKQTVVDTPPSTREVVVPAEYKTIKKTVLKTPATTREITIPAEYSTVKATKLAQPGTERRIAIPAEYDTITKRIKTSEEKLDWRSVVCDVNLNSTNVASLQRALKSKNQYDGPIDGIFGPMTLKGANNFAKANGLPTGTNYIANSVIEKLNLNF